MLSRVAHNLFILKAMVRMVSFRRFCLSALALAVVLSSEILLTAQQYPTSLYQEMQWRVIGPFRGGRTRAACGVPSQPNVFYVGQVNGGVWKSDDFGRTWNPIFDDQPTQSIGAIAVAPSDPNIVYVASGEGLQRPDLSVGNGIYKSTDAGKTWTHLGLRDGQQIPALVVDPHNPNRLFAAVLGHPYGANEERGIFRSTDGGDTWQKVLYKNENIGASDVQMDPNNPNVIYASLWEARLGPWEDNNEYAGSGGGLFKSTDGGDTWNQLSKGLPDGLQQIYVAIAPSDSNRLYANTASAGSALGIYRSDDAGESWSKITDDRRPGLRIGGGDLPVPKVDPKNPDIVYSTSVVAWRSGDGGKTWTGFRGAPGGDDYQNIWINPNYPGIILLVSDQGAIVSVNGGRTWSSWYNQPTAQMYHAITDNRFPYWVYGGQQESGSAGVASRGNDGAITFREFHPVGVIEYGYVAPDPLHPDIIYGAGRSEVSKFSWTTGQVQNVTPIPVRSAKYRTDRTEPIVFSPVDPHVLYYATNVLFKTIDGGQSWQTVSKDLTRPHPGIPANLGKMAADDKTADTERGAIYSLSPSFKSVNTLWAGTDDGLVWITRDGGKNWKDITPPDLLPWSKVTQISSSRFDDQTAYISVSSFRINDLHPYIYRTHDGGESWRLITSGLPDHSPVNTVRADPERKGLLFTGTEINVWVSFDDGDHWQSLQLNLPHTSMRDLWIHDSDLIVATHGRSFWILDDITPLRQISGTVEKSEATLFKPEAAYRIKRDAYTDTPLPPDEPAGKNPPDGAVLDYYLGSAASSPVTLEILDGSGKLVRRYSSANKPEMTEAEMAKTAPVPLYWLRNPKVLSAEAGMHRWVWDLHYPAPEAAGHSYPISAIPHDTPSVPLGPTALPGVYTVRLTVNGHSFTAPLTVKMDPRVKVTREALVRQLALEQQLVTINNGTYGARSQAQSAQEQLQKLATQASGSTADAIGVTAKKLKAVKGGGGFFAPVSQVPTLSRVAEGVNALYSAVGNADAEPTTAQVAATAELLQDFGAVIKKWDELKKVDFPALNQKLREANLPEINLEQKPESEPASENVE
jgi:photosystem II stability/assembly factor-like uncharacterized protein